MTDLSPIEITILNLLSEGNTMNGRELSRATENDKNLATLWRTNNHGTLALIIERGYITKDAKASAEMMCCQYRITDAGKYVYNTHNETLDSAEMPADLAMN